MGKLIQWEALIRSVDHDCRHVDLHSTGTMMGLLTAKTMGISNLSLSLSHEYNHPDSLQCMHGKEGSKQHFLE
jgi:hypothetical protein